MERPADGPFACDATGVDKEAIITFLLREERRVAFASDGFPDLSAACLVDAEQRFARSDLGDACREKGLVFRPFDPWQEVVDILVSQPSWNP